MFSITINEEIKSIIEKPTVTTCKDGSPIEYRGTKSVRKIKSRKLDRVSVNLISYVVNRGGAKSSLERFSSGDLSRFLSLYKMFE